MKINTDIDIEIKSPVVKNIFLAVFIVLLLTFVSYQFYVYYGSEPEVETQTALSQTISRNITASAFVIREERYVENNYSGTVVPAVGNGSKVSAGDTVVRVFASESDADTAARLSELEDDINYYKRVSSSDAGIMPADISLYKNNVSESLYRLSDAVNADSLEMLSQLSRQLREDITKKQIAVGVTVDVSARLGALTAEYNAISAAAQNYFAVSAAQTGYFVNTADGFESTADFSSAKELSCAAVSALLFKASEAVPAGTVGKLVTGFNWYLVCNVSDSEVYGLSVGSSVKVSFLNCAVGEMKMKIEALNPDTESGQTALVLSSNEMNAQIASLRKLSVKIKAEEYSGYTVDSKALRTVEGETGVYVKLGNIVKFRKINIIYSDDNVILASSEENESGYLRLYDEIITGGTDLYDGKILA